MTKQANPTAKTAAAKAAKQAPKAAAPQVAAPVTVALRGGAAVAQVKLTGKAYRSAAKHNTDWWATITQAATVDKPAAVAALVEAKVPTHFIGYVMRRGYLTAA